MEWVQTTGKNIEDALGAALDLLGVDVTDAEYEILDEGKSGIFGRTKREARIRARVRPSIPRSKDANRRTRRRRDDRSNTRRTEEPVSEVSRKSEKEVLQQSSNRGERSIRRAPTRMSNEDVPEESMEETVPLVDQAGAAQEFLAGLMREFQIPGQVEVQAMEDDHVSLAITGDANYGLLIGPKGLVMGSVQELTRASVQNRFRRANGRIFLDIGGFKEKRRASLESFALRIGEEVRMTGKQKALEPMNAADRKVVHDAMTNFDGVATSSEGREPKRYVIVAPTTTED